MERLTDRGYKNRAFMKEPVLDEEQRMVDIIDRLAAIEDILGDEYDLGHLRELVQAEQDGRLVVLPKEGDTP